MKPRIGHIELFVVDPKRSAAFYRDVLGFELVVEQARSVWLKCGENEVVLRAGKNSTEKTSYSESSQGIVLYTDDLPAEQDRLKSRGLKFRGTDGAPNCPTFTDPDGHWFQLVNPAEQ